MRRPPHHPAFWLLLFVWPWCAVTPAAAQTETVEYYGHDAIGSVRVVFDGAGNILARLDYEPFGRELTPSANAPDRKFAQLFRDGEAGLDYARARSYQVRTGRFSAPDPLYAGLFEPQQANRYAYAANNPQVFVDPTGLRPTECKQVTTETYDESSGYTTTVTLKCEGGGGISADALEFFQRLLAGRTNGADSDGSWGRLGRAVRERAHGQPCSVVCDSNGNHIEVSIAGVPSGGAVGAAAVASSRVLARALEAAGEVRSAGEAAHHIVAGSARAAAAAQSVLVRFGIGINDAVNGIFLPATKAAFNGTGAAVHSTLHTNAYYNTVNQMLLSATSRAEVVAALNVVKQGLRAGGF